MVVGVIGLVLGGEWGWNLGFVAVWLILFGLFAGPLISWVSPEIVAERQANVGALIGLVPGILYALFRFAQAGWLSVVAILVGSIFGGLLDTRASSRLKPAPMPLRLRRRLHRSAL